MIRPEDVAAMAALVDPPVEEGRRAAVAEQLDRIRQIAAPLFAVTLDPSDEIGPEWRP